MSLLKNLLGAEWKSMIAVPRSPGQAFVAFCFSVIRAYTVPSSGLAVAIWAVSGVVGTS